MLICIIRKVIFFICNKVNKKDTYNYIIDFPLNLNILSSYLNNYQYKINKYNQQKHSRKNPAIIFFGIIFCFL